MDVHNARRAQWCDLLAGPRAQILRHDEAKRTGLGIAQLDAGVGEHREVGFHLVNIADRRHGEVIGPLPLFAVALHHADAMACAAKQAVPCRALAFGEADGQVEAPPAQFARESEVL